MKKGCLWTLLIMVVLTMMCTIPYKKYKGYDFTGIWHDSYVFDLRGTYNTSPILESINGNPYYLSLYFPTRGVYRDAQVLVTRLELSVVSTGEIIFSSTEDNLLEPRRANDQVKDSPSHASYLTSNLKVPYEPCKLVVTYQVIGKTEKSKPRTVGGVFKTKYEEHWFNPMWSAMMSV